MAPKAATWINGAPLPLDGTSATMPVKPGATYCLRLEVTDVAGNVRTSPQRCVGVPLDSTSLKRTRQWRVVKSARYYRGSLVKTATQGAMLKWGTVRTRRVALVASTCSTCGRVAVYLGKTRLGTVSLASRKTKSNVVLPVKTLKNPRAGRLLLRVVSKDKPVLVDGVAISAK
jgi:hypothetical protein